jgi:hypothetical protein
MSDARPFRKHSVNPGRDATAPRYELPGAAFDPLYVGLLRVESAE